MTRPPLTADERLGAPASMFVPVDFLRLAREPSAPLNRRMPTKSRLGRAPPIRPDRTHQRVRRTTHPKVSVAPKPPDLDM